MPSEENVEPHSARGSLKMATLSDWVSGSAKLIAIFGAWPSFHDFEVLKIELARDAGKVFTQPVMVVTIHAFDISKPLHSREHKDTRIALRFSGVEDLKLDQFDHQNAIADLVISPEHSERLKQQIFRVTFLPGTGFECKFTCREIVVDAAEPFVPTRGAYA